MVTVCLYGFLGHKYGRRHKFAINSAAEAIRALCANFKGFKSDLVNSNQYYKVLVGKDNRSDIERLHLACNKASVIRIVPIVQGAGGNFGKVLVGAALIGFSLANPAFAQIGLVGSSTVGSVAGAVGLSLVLGGVSGMLFSPPKLDQSSSERPNNRPSFAFNGAINTTGQGNAVPLCYGEFLCGSQVISSGLAVDDLPN